jgi:trafficking protein particle complex subunit 10
MILHVVPKSSSVVGRSASRFTMKGSVYDKIRADFNSSKKDRYKSSSVLGVDCRCAQLRSCDTEGEELEMWQDILGKIKEGVLQSFDSRVLQYEEDIRKMDSQRTLPGWNYCTFFILKEGLAQSFEQMLLREDALIQYDELEASFFQLLGGISITIYVSYGR